MTEMICDICGQSGAQIWRVTRNYGRGTTLLVIQNVPIVSCPHCGENYLNAETLHEIERMVEMAFDDLRSELDPEMADDIRAYDEAKKAIAEGEELIPSEITFALLDGANPVRVWREHRGLTQQQLAQAAGISVPYLSQIESEKRVGSPDVLAALARGLARSLDDLVVA